MNSTTEPAAMVEVEMFLAEVRHNGVLLSVQEQSKNGGERRFACVMVPLPMDEDFLPAAMDYMCNVIGLSRVVAKAVHAQAFQFQCTSLVGGSVYSRQEQERMDELVSRLFPDDPELRMAVVEHNGVVLSIMQQDTGNHTGLIQPRFARLVIHDHLEGDEWSAYHRAASDYLENVVGFSNGVMMRVMQDSMNYRQAEMREAEKAEKEARTAPALDPPVRMEGPPEKQFESTQWGDVQRNSDGVPVLYTQTFECLDHRVVLKFFNRENQRIDPNKGDKIWSHCWTAFVPGMPCVHEHQMERVVMRNRTGYELILDYTQNPTPINLPGILTLYDFDEIEVSYYNMEMRGSPPPWNPGAVRVK